MYIEFPNLLLKRILPNDNAQKLESATAGSRLFCAN